MSIKEHLHYLSREAIKKNSFSKVTLLNSLYKKMQEQHGIQDRDDLSRGINVLKRKQINDQLLSIPEVVDAINGLKKLGSNMG